MDPSIPSSMPVSRRAAIVFGVALGTVLLVSSGVVASATLAVGGPAEATPGETVSLSFSLENTGETDRAFVLNVSTPEDWNIVNATNDGGVWSPEGSSWLWRVVDAGGSVSPTLRIAVPAGANGTFTVEATAKTSEGVVATDEFSLRVDPESSSSSPSPGLTWLPFGFWAILVVLGVVVLLAWGGYRVRDSFGD